MRSILFIVAIAAAACGGASKSDTTEPAPATGTMPADEHAGEEHSNLPAEVHAFHEQLAPLWHSEAADRQAATCAKGAELADGAAKIEGAAAPEGVDAAAWTAAAKELTASAQALVTDCGAGAADFDAKFNAVHERFHGLIELLPADKDAADKAAS
jgi:hypothetical protein